MGLQRDTTFNGAWTNGEGYNDGTAGAALNNVMREKRIVERQPTPKSRRDDATEYISVAHPKAKNKEPKQQPNQKTESEILLKGARTVFTICQQVSQLQGLSIVDIVLQDKQTKHTWNLGELMAPPAKKKE